MSTPATTPTEAIREMDGRLLVSGARLTRYRADGLETSARVQRGVIDRQLDARLVLMAQRDRT